MALFTGARWLITLSTVATLTFAYSAICFIVTRFANRAP
ncbi:hypothetical protein D515_04436 [Grimontia indica]|uniref:Uncharacterized protein n=1 Tax=Grimontia indica TaxID=1056512 RepID=R1I929_9GAMM|nr:hypothetical protein D515_04436 [Grimontia indica]